MKKPKYPLLLTPHSEPETVTQHHFREIGFVKPVKWNPYFFSAHEIKPLFYSFRTPNHFVANFRISRELKSLNLFPICTHEIESISLIPLTKEMKVLGATVTLELAKLETFLTVVLTHKLSIEPKISLKH